jgi:glyoxylase-like metal-dependent hydrolase (beta-lactamase superfamily II)
MERLLRSRPVSHVIHRVGSVEVTAVLDADFASGPIVESFPDVPAADVLAAKPLDPGVYTEDDRWRLYVRAWLVRHAGGLLLFDTGLGGATSPTQSWAPITGALARELDAIGIGRAHIDTVVISHAHDDHIGGVLDDAGAPMFPNARYVIQQADRDWLRDLAPTDEEAAACLALLRPLADAGILEVIGGDHRINTALQLHHMPGHTPGHQVLRIEAGDHRLILCADTWNHPMQFAHPDWPSGQDNHHAQSAAARRSLLGELLAHPGTIIAPTHFDEAFGEVRSDHDGVAAWAPL